MAYSFCAFKGRGKQPQAVAHKPIKLFNLLDIIHCLVANGNMELAFVILWYKSPDFCHILDIIFKCPCSGHSPMEMLLAMAES